MNRWYLIRNRTYLDDERRFYSPPSVTGSHCDLLDFQMTTAHHCIGTGGTQLVEHVAIDTWKQNNSLPIRATRETVSIPSANTRDSAGLNMLIGRREIGVVPGRSMLSINRNGIAQCVFACGQAEDTLSFIGEIRRRIWETDRTIMTFAKLKQNRIILSSHAR
jgi:hypothetical protein